MTSSILTNKKAGARRLFPAALPPVRNRRQSAEWCYRVSLLDDAPPVPVALPELLAPPEPLVLPEPLVVPDPLVLPLVLPELSVPLEPPVAPLSRG
jgi:hypothetical protein